MIEVDDEENHPRRNTLPSSVSHILEHTDEDTPPPLEDRDDSNDDSDGIEEPEESAEAELGSSFAIPLKSHAHFTAERLSKDWTSPVYVFFKPTPAIEYIKEHRVHVFECAAKHCHGRGNGRQVRRYLDTGDAKSTSNLRKHAKTCWGEEAVAAADSTKDIKAAREALGKMKNIDGSITAVFETIAKGGKVTYSHRQHTKTEARYGFPPPPFSFVSNNLL